MLLWASWPFWSSSVQSLFQKLLSCWFSSSFLVALCSQGIVPNGGCLSCSTYKLTVQLINIWNCLDRNQETIFKRNSSWCPTGRAPPISSFYKSTERLLTRQLAHIRPPGEVLWSIDCDSRGPANGGVQPRALRPGRTARLGKISRRSCRGEMSKWLVKPTEVGVSALLPLTQP